MKKYLSIIGMLVLLCIFPANAQVDNYALRFNAEGNVSLGEIPELNDLSSFTIQFWAFPSQWNTGGSIYRRGNGFAAQMGAENEMIFRVGNESISVKSLKIALNNWTHFTFISGGGKVSVRVNNTEVLAETKSLLVPVSSDIFTLGGSFAGRIDEFRIWKTVLASDYNYMWQNTLNCYHPQWADLVAYYKFDQNLCTNIVDYTYQHHGTLSEQGVVREIVTDNDAFHYFTVAAYTDFSRFSDRAVDREKYLLANTLIILGIGSSADGTAAVSYPYNHGTVTNGNYLGEYEGRKGVLSLNGQGAKMDVGTSALRSSGGYTFYTWVYLDEWTEGAYLIRKELSDQKGFSIRLGGEADRQVIVRIDGREYIRDKKMTVGKWVHVGVSTNSSQYPGELFMFSFDGVASFPSRGNFPVEGGTYELTGLENVPVTIGENLYGKLDDTAIWIGGRGIGGIVSDMNGLPMPGLSKVLEASILHSVDSYWAYDLADDLGYDSYSYKHFINIMRSAYEGHRGYKIKMSVSGHSGWETTFADPVKRKSLGEAIAKIANENDFDGVDLDFEWTYSDYGWLNYAKLVEIIRQNLNEGKMLTVTPHKVSYRFPVDYMKYVDYFLFQIYGPNDKNIFSRDGFQEAYNLFVNWGYPKDKIVMSYATTTSGGFDANGNLIKNGSATRYPPVGVRNLFDDTYSPEIDKIYDKGNGCYRYITGYDQVVWRNEFARTNGLKGTFYWDMGNDVKTAHPYSLPKGANFSLSANVDSIVTKVDNVPPVPPSGIIKAFYHSGNDKLIIHPNPAKESVSFEIPDCKDIQRIEIYNTQGQCVMNVHTEEKKIMINDFLQGIYTAIVYTVTGETFKGTFLKI